MKLETKEILLKTLRALDTEELREVRGMLRAFEDAEMMRTTALLSKGSVVVFDAGRKGGRIVAAVERVNAKSISVRTITKRHPVGEKFSSRRWRVHPSYLMDVKDEDVEYAKKMASKMTPRMTLNI